MYSSLTDIIVMFRDLTVAETAKATRLLEFAAGMLRQQVPQLDARLAARTLDREAVAAVSTAMVVRVLQNPDGHRQGSVSADDVSKSWTVDAALSSGALYIADTELAWLAPPMTRLRVGTIRLGHAL